MKKSLKLAAFFTVTAMAAVLFGGCESKKLSVSSYYVGNWNSTGDNILYLGSDGNYELYTSIGTDTGSYSFKGDTLTLSGDDGNTYSYDTVSREYILARKYDGTVPDGDTFDATFISEKDNGGEKLSFYESGSMSLEIYITNLSDNRISGTYSRDGNLLHCDFTLYGERDYLVVDGELYAYYGLEKDYEPTPTPTEAVTETEEESETADGDTESVTEDAGAETEENASENEEATETQASETENGTEAAEEIPEAQASETENDDTGSLTEDGE